MEISVIAADKEAEKRLIATLAQVALEAREEDSGETDSRILPCVDHVE